MRMANKAQNITEPNPFIEARVTGVCDGVFGLSSPLGQLTARRAVSCLLEPAAGDTVLTVHLAEGCWYVLAVLTRGESPPVVSLPADSIVRSTRGGLTIAAQGELALAGGERTSLTTPVLEVQAEQAHASFSLLRATAGLIESTATRVRHVADLFETVADCIRQRAGSMYREVKDLDHLKAGQVYYKAETVLNMRGKHSVLSAEGEVKIDGTRVHLG
ncbi:MAG TPA: DUF3540 domain-containing protein [Gammaproteobacteria bacterium]